jgi:hypothetical protein
MKSALLKALLLCMLLLVVLPATASINPSPVGSHSIVITQVYINGGNTSAPYTTGYIELFNAGPVTVDLTDFTLQYQNATGSMGPTNSFLLGPNSSYTTGGVTYPANSTFTYGNGFNGKLKPGQYLLIQLPGQGSVGVANPVTADIVLTKSINQTTIGKPSTTGGKYAVVHSVTTGIYCGTNSTNPARSNLTTDPYNVLIGPMATDFVGYNVSAAPNCYEGAAAVNYNPVSGSKNVIAAVRSNGADGCPIDTNNNGADFTMLKIGPGTTGWKLHNSTSVMTNGDPASITGYMTNPPTVCTQSLNTVSPTVDAIASLASDSSLAPVTKIQAGVDTLLALTVTVTNGGVNPTSAIGYYMTADLTGIGTALKETSLVPAPQKLGYLGTDAGFGNPQYQFPIPAENPPPASPPNATFTLHPDVSEKGNTYTIPITVLDDAQRQITTNVSLQVVGSTPGQSSLTVTPASVPATTPTSIDLTAVITDPGLYPQATSYTVTMDLSSIGGSNVVTCPMVSTDVYTCHTTVTADVAMVGGSYTIPVTIVDDQTRTLTLTPASIQIGVTAAPEPVAALAWSLSSTGNFGSVTQSATSSAQTAILTNTGLAPLSIGAISGSGDFAATTDCAASLDPSASCTISVKFTPTAIGTRTGTLTVTDNSHLVANSQQALALTGIGMAPPPNAVLSAAQLSFGNMIVTTASTAQTVTLSNNGGQALAIAGLTLSGTDKSDFSYTTNCGASLAVGANCTFAVTFKPTTAGNKTATLSVSDNAAGSPHAVQLSGAGVDFPVGPVSNGSTTATITAGQTATYNMQVSPAGPFSGAVTIACTTIIQGATCTVNPASVTVNGSAVPFTVSIATAARSVAHAGPGSSGPSMPAICLAVLSALAIGFASSKKVRLQLRGAVTCVALLCVLGMTACAGLKTNPWPDQPSISTPAGTYTVTLKATYGAVVRTTTLTLNVQ